MCQFDDFDSTDKVSISQLRAHLEVSQRANTHFSQRLEFQERSNTVSEDGMKKLRVRRSKRHTRSSS